MQTHDFITIAQSRLAEQQQPATERLRRLFTESAAADHFLFEYLPGLDHAILAYARRADDTNLNDGDKTLFAGLADYLAELTAADRHQGTALANAFRSDEQVAEVLDAWFAACWQAAGGAALPVTSFYMYEGDSSLLNLQTQHWQDSL
jgi:hypothetical protein